MLKRITNLVIIVVMLFSVVGITACTNETEVNMNTISFELGNKTTDYFEDDNRGQLLVIIKSIDELTHLLEEKQFNILPMYDAIFFEEHSLVLYFFVADIYNDIDLTVKSDDNTLYLLKSFDLPHGMGKTAERSWTFMIEIKSTDMLNLSQVKLK